MKLTAIVPTFSSRAHLLRPAIPRPSAWRAAEAFAVLNWIELHVPNHGQRLALNLRIRSRATKEPVADLLRDMNIPRESYERRRRAALDAVVRMLNCADVPAAA